MTDFSSLGEDPMEEEEGFLGSFADAGVDVALGPLRGAAGAVAGVSNLFGADVQDNFGLGHSEGLGGFMEGAVQFLVGFIPGLGAAGYAGKISKFSSIATKSPKLAGIAKGAAAGAVADFAVFDGNDPRFSNLIQSIPGLANPVTEYLASNEEDPELFGRMKNVIEGAGLGAMAEGFIQLFRGLKGLNEAKARGDKDAIAVAEKEIEEIAEDTLTIPGAEDLADQESLMDLDAPKDKPEADFRPPLEEEEVVEDAAEEITPEMVRERIEYDPEQGEALLITTDDTSGVMRGLSQFDQVVREPGRRLEVAQLKNKKDLRTLRGNSKEATKLIGGRVKKGTTRKEREDLIISAAREAGDIDVVTFSNGGRKETVILNEDAIYRRINVASKDDFWGTRAKALANKDPELVATSPLEHALYHHMELDRSTAKTFARELAKAQAEGRDPMGAVAGLVNYDKMGERQVRAFYEVISTHFNWKDTVDDTVPWEETVQAANKQASEMLGVDPVVTANRLKGDAESVRAASERAVATRAFLIDYEKRIGVIAQSIVDTKKVTKDATGRTLTQEEALELLARQIETYTAIGTMYGRVRAEFGRGTRAYAIGADKLEKWELLDSITKRGGVDRMFKNAQRIAEEAKFGTGHLSKLMMAHGKRDRIWAAITDWYMFSLLSAVRTITTNVIGSAATMMYRPTEAALGAWVSKGILGKGAAEGIERELASNLRKPTIMWNMMVDAIKYRGKAGGDPIAAGAWNASKRAFKTNKPVLDSRGSPFDMGVEQRSGIDVENIEAITGRDIDPTSTMGAAINWLGKLTQLPSKWLGATDEFIKQISYHAHIKTKLIDDANALGLKGQQLDDWVLNEMRKRTRDGAARTKQQIRLEADQKYPAEQFQDPEVRIKHMQAYIDKHLESIRGSSLVEEALEVARADTFTTPLRDDRGFLSKGGRLIQEFTAAHPAMRFFAPFVRTPLNLLMFTADRLPVPGLNREFIPMMRYIAGKKNLPGGLTNAKNKFVQDMMDPKFAAEAMGRATTAIAIGSSLGIAATAGVFTGRGPQDPGQAKVLKQTGWQPYSIKVGDTYISYQRLDPFASLLAFYADWSDVARYGTDDDGIDDLAFGMFTATLENLQNKSYLAGVIDLVNLISDPETQIKRTTGRILGTLVMPNMISAARGFTDPHAAELTGVLDRVIARVPFLSSTVTPQRDVLGEVVSKRTYSKGLQRVEGFVGYMMPVMINVTGSDVVTEELSNLAFPIRAPQPVKYGVDLREQTNDSGQTAYDRWQELTGQVEIRGRKLRPAMERLINSRRYQSLATESVDRLDLDSPRIQLIRSLLGQYRRAAEREMLQEYPRLQEQTRTQRLARQALKAGASSDDIRSLVGR